MKYLKKFEKLNLEPKIGDYIIASYHGSGYKDTDEYLNSNIGIVRQIDLFDDQSLRVEYADAPENIHLNSELGYSNNGYWWFRLGEIRYFSKNRKELEQKLVNIKYNI